MRFAILGAVAALVVVGAFMVVDKTLFHWYASEESASEERIEDLEKALEELDDADEAFPPLPPAAGPQSGPRAPEAPRAPRAPRAPIEFDDVPTSLDYTGAETFDYVRLRCVPKGPDPLACGFGERFDFVNEVCVQTWMSCTALEEFDVFRERCVPAGS